MAVGTNLTAEPRREMVQRESVDWPRLNTTVSSGNCCLCRKAGLGAGENIVKFIPRFPVMQPLGTDYAAVLSILVFYGLPSNSTGLSASVMHFTNSVTDYVKEYTQCYHVRPCPSLEGNAYKINDSIMFVHLGALTDRLLGES